MQVKLWDPLRARGIPERVRGVLTIRRYTNPRLPYLTLTYLTLRTDWLWLLRVQRQYSAWPFTTIAKRCRSSPPTNTRRRDVTRDLATKYRWTRATSTVSSRASRVANIDTGSPHSSVIAAVSIMSCSVAILHLGSLPFSPFSPCPFTSVIFCFFYFSLSFIGFTYFLLLSIPSLSTRIVTLRFQAEGRRKRPNLGLVCFVCVICIPQFRCILVFCCIWFNCLSNAIHGIGQI